jgi:hypothetical protein
MAADLQLSRILLVKGCEGIGNRLLGLLSGMLYSRLSGRQLVVDWCDPLFSLDGENAFPLLFARPAVAITPKELRGRSIAPEDWSDWPEATVASKPIGSVTST